MFEDAGLVFGTVVLVPFPFTDQSGSKKRAAVVISGKAYQTARNDVVMMPITSQVRSEMRFGDALLQDWEAAGLLKPSAVKGIVGTFEQPLIYKILGIMSERDAALLRRSLFEILADMPQA